MPGEQVLIAPFSLVLCQPVEKEICPDVSVATTLTCMKDDDSDEIVRSVQQASEPLAHTRLRELDKVIDSLGRLTSPADLYPEVCRQMVGDSRALAAVVRVPGADRALPASPLLLACYCGDIPTLPNGKEAKDVHLSRRVLETVRAAGDAVMASNAPATDAQMGLTVAFRGEPRTVFCAPVSDLGESVDLLYVDVAAEQALPDTLGFVQSVARQVSLVRNSLMLSEAKAERSLLDHRLSAAQEIQSRLIPTKAEDLRGVDVAVRYQPAMWVGGDYCDVWVLPNGRLAFAIADVSGKGLPAAMVMANLQAALRITLSFCTDIAQGMDYVNQHLRRYLPSGTFVTLFLGSFDPAAGQLEYVNAGHVLPLVFSGPKGVRPLGKPTNPVVGIGAEPFRKDFEIIPPRAGLVVVTDGVTETISPAGEQFAEERLADLLRDRTASSADELSEAIARATESFRGSRPQQDDLTAFVLVNHRTSSSTTKV